MDGRTWTVDSKGTDIVQSYNSLEVVESHDRTWLEGAWYEDEEGEKVYLFYITKLTEYSTNLS